MVFPFPNSSATCSRQRLDRYESRTLSSVFLHWSGISGRGRLASLNDVTRWSVALSAILFRVSIVVFAMVRVVPDARPSATKQDRAATPSSAAPSRSASATSSDSESPPDPLGEARTLAQKGDFEGAIKKYQQLLQERPKSPDAYAGLTRVYLKKKSTGPRPSRIRIASSTTKTISPGQTLRAKKSAATFVDMACRWL